jgi:hypothetical protein
MKSMTFETKDDGYCSSECSNMSECSMDSMESIISGIEALVVEDHENLNFSGLDAMSEPRSKGRHDSGYDSNGDSNPFPDLDSNCWKPLEAEIKQGSPTSMEKLSRVRESNWAEMAKNIKAHIDRYEASIIPEYREKKKMEEQSAFNKFVNEFSLIKTPPVFQTNFFVEDDAILDFKMETKKDEEPSVFKFFSNPDEDSSRHLKAILGIPC